MKHLSFRLQETKSFTKAKKEATKKKYKSQLIQLFCSTTHKKSIQKILDKLTEEFPNAIIIGTITAGEISHAKMYENESVVSLSLFENTRLQVSHAPNITIKSAKKLSQNGLTI